MVTPRTAIAALLLTGLFVACSGSQRAGNSGVGATSSPANTVVARYAGTAITQAELDSAFAESAGGRENAADSSRSAYRDFLDQYLNFRLKVRAARDAGLDTLPSIRQDIQSYRQKLARPALLREEVYEPAARTLYERQKEAVDVSHILIRTSNRDTLSAYRTAQSIADSLDQGIPFAELAYRNSEDPSARKKGERGFRGRLGYIRAGQIVKPFEERMYALEPGETSDIFRTKYGYHILKVHDRRPTEPPIRLSHILRRSKGTSGGARQFLDSLRTEIVSGEVAFAAAAKKHSQHRPSASKGGTLGDVNPQTLPDPLRKAVASMDTVGTVSGVVETRFGHHLLKLTDRQERQSFEEAYDSLKDRVSDQPRAERRKANFARDVRAEVGVTVDTTRLLDAANIASTDSLARPLLSLADSVEASPDVATLGDSTYTLRQLARHLTQTDGGVQMTVGALIESFLNEKAIQYAVIRRAQRDPSLAEAMKKYREGALLFRYMQDSVWTAATQDSAGLRATYRRNQDQYRFPERVRTIVFRAPSDTLLQPYKTAYDEDRSLQTPLSAAVEDSLVSADTVYVTDQSAEVYQPVRSAEDLEAIGPTSREDEWLFMIRDTRLSPRPKTFEEARNSVVQDYQETYEQTVIRQLRNRYDAQTYPDRLRPPSSDPSSTS
ncbi:MAG: peptidylprolyl isomerase [Bacteroidetes bacterium SW_7_64_58]|nr:MAG: peptidylprolyl isomerase [Bacteroidetes bacterium SW_7_64_58]